MKNTTCKPLGRYADILYDRWFKRTFGPQEQVNPNEAYKDVWLDVECTDEDGTRFLVEMQLKRQAGFFDRAVFVSSFGIQKRRIIALAKQQDAPER